MSKHQRKLLLSAGVALVAMLVASLQLAWFEMDLSITGDLGLGSAAAALDSARLDIGLDGATACMSNGTCASTSMNNLSGVYPSLATFTFWSTIILCGIIAVQAAMRLVTGAANGFLTRLGYLAVILAIVGAGLTAFLFAPETAETTVAMVTVHRTWAPGLMFGGYVVAFYTLYLVAFEEVFDDAPPARDAMHSQPIVPIKETRVAFQSEPIVPIVLSRVPGVIRHKSEPEPILELEPQTPVPPAPALAACPAALERKLAYAAAIVTFTGAGLDGQREDGSAKRVAWADVVGVVARRLPADPPFDGITFVDLVSLAGSTLRVLPWTSVGGELTLPANADGAERARAFVQLIAARCP
ncbi:MAG: hypothetical protein ABI678_11110, partial [Kofleriaceae bacterium]